MEWGLGRYERTAAALRPAAETTVRHARLQPGERVIDVGCGTGNASLLAAELGARVTGVDPSPRLLEVARAEAAARTLEADFVVGEAAALPLPDAAAGVVVSVFGVIFAPDARTAAAEIARVLDARGQIVISAWLPEGPIFGVMRLRREALVEAGAERPAARPFAWHDLDAVRDLLSPQGFSVATHEHELSFSAASAEGFLDAEMRDHPLWVQARPLLESNGALERVREQAITLLTDANEDRGGFRINSRYAVLTAGRGS